MFSGCGEFQHPCGIAVDYKHDDRLIVTDFNNNRVQVSAKFKPRLHETGTKSNRDHFVSVSILLTYDCCELTLLFSLQYLSESCFGNDNAFLLPNP